LPYDGPIAAAASPVAPATALVVLAAGQDGRLLPSAAAVVHAARSLVRATGDVAVLLVAPTEEAAQRNAVGALRAFFAGEIVVLAAGEMLATAETRCRWLRACWPAETAARFVVGESWAESAFAALAGRATPPDPAALRVRRAAVEGERCVLETARAGGKLRAARSMPATAARTVWITLADGAEIKAAERDSVPSDRLQPFQGLQNGPVRRWAPDPERLSLGDARRWLDEVRGAIGVVRLADAEFIIDVGFGVGSRDGYDAVVPPLEQALRALGVRDLAIGGSRKVTEELHLLPADRQIGQSGVSVAPRVLLALGVSGAPQHLNYIGGRTVILAFNRDPEAPLLTLNRRQAQPRVLPIVGDLFETVSLLTAALRQETSAAETGAGSGTEIVPVDQLP
jgi:electron transfer flavoprotein alpha subunit